MLILRLWLDLVLRPVVASVRSFDQGSTSGSASDSASGSASGSASYNRLCIRAIN